MNLPPLSGLILAAGRSTRMGRPKALLPLGPGTLIEQAVALFREAGLRDILAVVGHRREKLAALLGAAGARVVVNPHYDAGMFSSVQAGVGQLDPAATGVFVLPVDVPLVRPWTLRHLGAVFAARPTRILVPTFAGQPGHPPLIPAALAPEIAAFRAPGGLRAFLTSRRERLQAVEVPDRHVLFDVDRPADYAELRARWRTRDVPTPAECAVIMTTIHPTPLALRGHGDEVARVADALARALEEAGEALDSGLLQAAALLHDICRKSPDHAAKGACFAAEVLVGFGFSAGEIADIRLAIESHEAFRPIRAAASVEANLVADCLYDADKFRWGPDNFRDTVWDMVAFHAPPLEVFLARYPAGLESLERIGQTFRSPTGRRFGPQFIRFGLAIGRELLAVIRRDFALRD